MEKQSEFESSAGTSPFLLTPDSDSALGTLSDSTPDEEIREVNSFTEQDRIAIRQTEDGDESDSESVVSASMQFPLTSSITANAQNEDELEIVSEKSPNHSSGVPILVKHEKLPGSTSPKKKIDDEDGGEFDSVSLGRDFVEDSNGEPCLTLPETVTQLTNEYGSKVFLVGTAHFSVESQQDVAKTIQLVRPNIVMVELCKSRTAVLQLDEETILNESQSLDFNKMRIIIRQHGKIQGILYLLLLSVSAHITKQLGMAPGGEFRTAFSEARRTVPGCLIQLGDRPIQITLSRALASLSVWQKMKLMWHIMASKEPISKDEVEKCKQKDFIEEMLADMTGQFPAISEVFVKERDIYLTKSLQSAAEPIPDRKSPSGLSPRVVVGVVGIGHVPGIVARWGTVMDDDIPPIMRIPPPNLSDRVFKYTLKFGFFGLVGFGLYKCVPKTAKSALYSTVESGVLSVSKYIRN